MNNKIKDKKKANKDNRENSNTKLIYEQKREKDVNYIKIYTGYQQPVSLT